MRQKCFFMLTLLNLFPYTSWKLLRTYLKWILRGMHKSNICYHRRFPCNPPLLSINTNINFADFCHNKYVIKRRGWHFTCIMHWNGSASRLPMLYVWDSCIKQCFGKENATTFLKLQFGSRIKQITVSVTSIKWIQFSYDILQSFGVNSHFGSYFHEHASRWKNFCLHFCPPCHYFATSSQYSYFDYRRYIILENVNVVE
jgi:hypothetical protein